MTASTDLHVVLGGTGGTGAAVVAALVADGAHIRIVTRSGVGSVPAGVQLVAADIANLEDARAACKDATHMYFCVSAPYTRWALDFPPMLEGAIAAAEATHAKLIVMDNLYVYPRTTAPMTEDLPWNPPSRKGAVRKAMDERLVAAHQAGTIRMAIARASDFHGPGARNTSTLGDIFFQNYLAGKPVTWIGKLDMLHTFSYTPDIGRGLVTLGANDNALGGVWHIPADEPLTGRQLLDMVFEEGNVRVTVRTVSGTMLRMIGLVSPLLREVAEMAYEFEEPFIMDGSKFTRAFGGTPTPNREGVRATVAWFREHKA